MSVKTRQEVKREWALAQIAKNRAMGNANPVIVMPVFINEGTEEAPVWVATSETGISGRNPEWCAVNVVSSQRAFRQGFMNEQYLSALIRCRVLNNTFKGGECLTGKIYTVESTTPSNPANLKEGIKYLSSALREADVPCTIADELVYQQHYYTDNMSEPDVLLPHDNGDAILLISSKLRVANANPNTGMDNAKVKAAKIAELQAIPKATRTKEQKLELAELLDA